MSKILLIANTSWYLFNFRKSLIKTLITQGYQVLCAAPFDDYSEKLSQIGVKYISVEYNNSNKNPLKDLLFFFKLIVLFNKYKPDIVLSYTIKANIYAGFAAQFTKTHIVANISGLGSLFLKNNIFSTFSMLLYKLGLRKADKIFFQNKDDYSLFIDKNIINKQFADLLPGSGVDINYFSKSNSNQKNDKFVFLFASRLLKDKGIIETVEAIKLLRKTNKNVELHVLGKTWPQNPSSIKQLELDNWITSGLINYLGFADDIRPYIEQADVILLPSYREGMSRILLEAASMSKPIITTDVAGCKEVVEDGLTGFLCKAQDSNDLAEKMLKMIDLSSRERILMGKRGREKMEEEFNEKVVIKKYLNTIKNLT